MKKIFVAVMALIMFSVSSFAQDAKKTKEPAKVTTTAQHLKKDGTADKRFKENKNVKEAATQHLKKDGTPDKRFKENKAPKAPMKKAA